MNGSVAGGPADKWCAEGWPLFLQVDLGAVRPVTRFVVKHASAGGENEQSDTRDFNIQLSADGKTFTTAASSTGAGFVDERTEYRQLVYFDGRREARFYFEDGKLQRRNINRLLDFEEDRTIFAGIFQYFYLRLAIFFGCLGIFMNLFRAEMSNRTLHFWLLAPARREVLLAGKYAAGLIASSTIFGGGAVLTLAAMIWPHDAVEVQSYWNAGGHEPRVLVCGGGRARLRRLRERLSRCRTLRPQSHHPGGGAARLGGGQRHSSARAAEDERPVLPAVPVSRPGADGE